MRGGWAFGAKLCSRLSSLSHFLPKMSRRAKISKFQKIRFQTTKYPKKQQRPHFTPPQTQHPNSKHFKPQKSTQIPKTQKSPKTSKFTQKRSQSLQLCSFYHIVLLNSEEEEESRITRSQAKTQSQATNHQFHGNQPIIRLQRVILSTNDPKTSNSGLPFLFSGFLPRLHPLLILLFIY